MRTIARFFAPLIASLLVVLGLIEVGARGLPLTYVPLALGLPALLVLHKRAPLVAQLVAFAAVHLLELLTEPIDAVFPRKRLTLGLRGLSQR